MNKKISLWVYRVGIDWCLTDKEDFHLFDTLQEIADWIENFAPDLIVEWNTKP